MDEKTDQAGKGGMVSDMKTEEIIRKCIELPGISMKTDGQSTELILSRDDHRFTVMAGAGAGWRRQ